MDKLIIENQTEIPLTELIYYIRHILSEGKVSKHTRGMGYCFHTAWENGITIVADKNKNSDRLIVYQEKK